MVDDSIVRGTTSKQIVQMLREAGAAEVHMAVASPPTKYPCYYGIDTEKPEQLIANSMTEREIEDFITADSLYYISKEGMIKSLHSDECNFCTACFSGNYPFKYENNKNSKGKDLCLKKV
ncbi:MAG: amidophosphoribosyltransferase, partial [Syntrophomonadaceae bacterium]|jgi:amidophosphoribosyltransferase|nr:amidophosphoribosyltransferase [Syntrophomonadaceae bacterium]